MAQPSDSFLRVHSYKECPQIRIADGLGNVNSNFLLLVKIYI